MIAKDNGVPKDCPAPRLVNRFPAKIRAALPWKLALAASCRCSKKDIEGWRRITNEVVAGPVVPYEIVGTHPRKNAAPFLPPRKRLGPGEFCFAAAMISGVGTGQVRFRRYQARPPSCCRVDQRSRFAAKCPARQRWSCSEQAACTLTSVTVILRIAATPPIASKQRRPRT